MKPEIKFIGLTQEEIWSLQFKHRNHTIYIFEGNGSCIFQITGNITLIFTVWKIEINQKLRDLVKNDTITGKQLREMGLLNPPNV